MVNKLENRLNKIIQAQGKRANGVSNRDRAYIKYLRENYANPFHLREIFKKQLPSSIKLQYDIKSGRLDDVTVLGVRLPSLGMLNQNGMMFCLTDRALEVSVEIVDG